MRHFCIKQCVTEMKDLSEILVPLTYPKADFKIEQDILLFKQRTVVFDGYELIVCYSKADYGKYFLESLQLQSTYAPFLPFIVVCKLGRAFLGENHICYIEFFKNNRKVYCWTLKTKNNKSLAPSKKMKTVVYEGFEFNLLQPGAVDLF